VNTPMSICKKRDSKNLYKKIKKNKLINPIGTVSGYEIPLNPDLEVDTLQYSANKIATKILSKL
jgi:adenylylsulfate kinase